MSRVIWSGLTLALLMSGFSVQAKQIVVTTGLVDGRKDCQVSDVQVTSVQKQNGDPVFVLPDPQDASACLGAYAGNLSTSGLGSNLGYDGQGYMNDKTLFPDFGAFITEGELQDLEFDDQFNDPGWIFVGKQNMKEDVSFKPETLTDPNDPTKTYTFTSDILKMQNCKDKNGAALPNCSADAVSGEWVYKPPQLNPASLMAILGIDKFFDQVAVVFKSSDQFAIYNFKLSDFDLDPVVGLTDANYIFTGTWDMSKTLINNGNQSAGLSHFDLWLHDPVVGTTTPNIRVPEPTTIAIFGISLLGLRLRRKH